MQDSYIKTETKREVGIKSWLYISILTILGTLGFISCDSSEHDSAKQKSIRTIAEKVWTLSQNTPSGFALDIHSMTEQTEGIAVAYTATTGSHSREQLEKVVAHALQHDGYIRGWQNGMDNLYHFDSFKLFSENEFKAAILFNKEQGQNPIFMLSSQTEVPVGKTIYSILDRDTILIGTTGDYRPLTFLEPESGEHWGFGIEVAQKIASKLGVEVKFVGTSWPTLTADVLAEPQMFDFAIGGITITEERCQKMLMSDGYLTNGKTILCRASEAHKYKSLADIDRPEVRVMVNPGGLNEKFANANLKQASIVVHQKNEEIPGLIAEGKADIMITEITEAPYYVKIDTRLAAPLLNTPFTRGEIGVLMRKGQNDLLQLINHIIKQMKTDSSLRLLHEKYGLVYAY